MTAPTLAVQIGTAAESGALVLDNATTGKLDTGGTLGDGYSLTWTNITSSVRVSSGVTINRGGTTSRGPYWTAEAGSLSFTLDNRTGAFDPFNASSPYYSGGLTLLRPGLPVRVTATHGGTTYPLFLGKVSSWLVDYPEQARDSVAKVTAFDGIGELSRTADAEFPALVGAGENAGARINRILDAFGWRSGARDIDTTTTDTLTATTLENEAWSEMQAVADSVNGYLFVDAAGSVVFRGRSNFARSSSFTIGTATGAVPTRTVQVSNDQSQLFNVIKLTNDDNVTVTLSDATSQTTYGGRYSYSRSGSWVSTETLLTDSATYLLSQYKDLRLRVEAFDCQASATWTDATWQRLLGLELLTRVKASFRSTDGRTIERDGLVRGMTITAIPNANVWRWEVSTTQAPEALGTFTLDSSALGLLDAGTLAQF
jgi:hypothetical protein